MAYSFTRQELYDQVWSEPMKKLAPRFGVSDVALAKACRRADIPVPERGYWARLQAGKTAIKRALPARGLGMSDVVSIGETPYETHEELVSRLLNEPIPAPPVFSEDLVLVADRVRRMVGRVRAPHVSHRLHPLVANLLDEDQRRLEAQQKSSFPLQSDAPLFDSPAGRRHLRILNAIFLCAQRYGARPWLRDRERRETGIQVGQQNVGFTIEAVGERRTPPQPRVGVSHKPRGQKLRLTIGSRDGSSQGKSWEDSPHGRLEMYLADIVVELLVAGEANYRTGAQASHEWWLQRRAQIEEEARRLKEERDRLERERRAKLEKERVELLLKEADNWRRAAELRGFVDIVRAQSHVGDAAATERLDRWARWVLALADRVDPIRAGRIPNETLEAAS